jgi:DnaJ-class molecular chaperone
MNLVDVFVHAGMKDATKVTLVGQGNQQIKRTATDLHITFKLKQAETGSNAALFSRKGDSDLYYTHKIKLVDAIQCNPICLTTLDGRNLRIAAD